MRVTIDEARQQRFACAIDDFVKRYANILCVDIRLGVDGLDVPVSIDDDATVLDDDNVVLRFATKTRLTVVANLNHLRTIL